MKQMSLFSPQFGSKIRRIEIGGVVYFSILDVFVHYGSEGSAKNPSVYWQRVKKALHKQGKEVLTDVLEHRFEGQGQRPTPVATFKFFMRIVQVSEIKEWEHIRVWMAELAHERVEEEANPELGIDRASKRYIDSKIRQGLSEDDAYAALQARLDGKSDYKQLMAMVTKVCSDTPRYGAIVNAEYVGLFGSIAHELENILKSKSIRDALPTMQLRYLQTAEQGIREILKQKGSLTHDQIVRAARLVCVPLGQHLQSLCEELGINHITGQQLLDESE
jgi:hypothetical protein